MERTTMHIGDRSYILAQDHNADALRQQLLSAVQAGGGWVQVELITGRALDVLVSPGITITTETETFEPDALTETVPFASLDMVSLGEYGL
jgi:hypothetical protein